MTHVLLIEPDLRLARTYYDALKTAGHVVTAVHSAQAAVLAADTSKLDVVVMELQLVGHSGVEFLYEFRSYADWQNVPLIIHSSIPPSEFAGARHLLMDELGVYTYLYKPQTSLKKLLATVRDAVPLTAKV